MEESIKQVMLNAGKLALQYFNHLDSLEFKRKSPKDLVTEADIEVENFLRKELFDLYPNYGFWGEESGKVESGEGRWIVDPIDGTHSFFRGQYFWSISVALEIAGKIQLGAVYAPALGDLYLAEKGKGAWKNGDRVKVSEVDVLTDSMVCTGFACLRSSLEDNNLERFCRIALKTRDQRRFGSAALDLCMVADGQLDAFWEQHLNLYDVAAGTLIALEAGGTVCNFKGISGLDPEEILVTNGKILDEMLELM